ncbi:hypothetical protein EH183_35530 [Streptomyces sp. CB01881]|nr:hypothetical protein C2142_35465 [Streptomyces sp. CB01881]TYC69476.1 hypothetical protein EH183_35530 [Streptomyces sp. CB01881]
MDEVLRLAEAENPGSKVEMKVYTGGQFGERYALVVAITKDTALTDAERAEALQDAWKSPDPASGVQTTFSGIEDVDAGPLGGSAQCGLAYSRREQPDVFGNHMFSTTQCVAIGTNTVIEYNESAELSGMKIAKTADDLRKFRAQAEVKR